MVLGHGACHLDFDTTSKIGLHVFYGSINPLRWRRPFLIVEGKVSVLFSFVHLFLLEAVFWHAVMNERK